MPCWQVGPTPGPHLIASSPRLAPRRIHTSASSSLECTTTSKNNKNHKNKSTRLHSTRAPPRARTLHSGLAWRRPRHPPRSRRSSTGGERASTAGAGAGGRSSSRWRRGARRRRSRPRLLLRRLGRRRRGRRRRWTRGYTGRTRTKGGSAGTPRRTAAAAGRRSRSVGGSPTSSTTHPSLTTSWVHV